MIGHYADKAQWSFAAKINRVHSDATASTKDKWVASCLANELVLLTDAKRFMLPPAGALLKRMSQRNYRLRDLNLPFSEFTLEFPVQHLGVHVLELGIRVPMKAMVLNCTMMDVGSDSVVRVSSITVRNATPAEMPMYQDSDGEVYALSNAELMLNVNNGEFRTLKNPSWEPSWEGVTLHNVDGTDMSEEQTAFHRQEHEVIGTVFYKLIPFFDFLAVANCANTVVKCEPEERLNKRRVQRGKEPFNSYHIVALENKARGVRVELGGHHASPRLHFRRGHVRNLQDKSVWVRDAMVGNSAKGRVEKSYTVPAKE